MLWMYIVGIVMAVAIQLDDIKEGRFSTATVLTIAATWPLSVPLITALKFLR